MPSSWQVPFCQLCVLVSSSGFSWPCKLPASSSQVHLYSIFTLREESAQTRLYFKDNSAAFSLRREKYLFHNWSAWQPEEPIKCWGCRMKSQRVGRINQFLLVQRFPAPKGPVRDGEVFIIDVDIYQKKKKRLFPTPSSSLSPTDATQWLCQALSLYKAISACCGGASGGKGAKLL